MAYMVFDCVTKTEVSTGAVSGMSTRASLAWAGFSDDFSLIVMDTEGMVSMLGQSIGWQWMPVLDTNTKKKNKEDNFWPVAVKDGKLVVVPLKGGNEYPEALGARPIAAVLPFRVPLARALGNSGDEMLALEEFSMRARTVLRQKDLVKDVRVEDENKDIDDLDAEYDKLCGALDKVSHACMHPVV